MISCTFRDACRLMGLALALATSLAPVSCPAEAGNRLLATGGVTPIDGGAGGGLTTWAVIAGYGTRDQIGGTAFATWAAPQDFWLVSYGAAVGFYDRFELSLAEQRFDLGTTVPNEQVRQRIAGLKVRLFGDAVYDSDTWRPQVSVGIQFRDNPDFDFIPRALGAQSGSGTDFYVAATKLWFDAVLGRNLLTSVTVRATKANQFGLLGYGGDRSDEYSLQPEGAVGLFLTDWLVAGAEYRAKPDNLSVFEEEDAWSAYVAVLPHKRVSVTAAYVDLGRIADKPDQRAPYVSLQLAF